MMSGQDDGLGKKAEERIREWLDDSKSNYSFDRFYDQLTGFYFTSRNICDFVCYKYPYQYYIESKATWKDRFEFSMISETQFNGLLEKSKIFGCFGLVIILFATYKRAFILSIEDIDNLIKSGKKSLNIKKIDKWEINYSEISTIDSKKQLLEYCGDLATYVETLEVQF